MKNKLLVKVAAVNCANEAANEIHPIFHAYFKPYVLQKIEKADGYLIKKIADNFPKNILVDRRQDQDGIIASYTIYRLNSNSSLAYVVKCYVFPIDSDGGSYHESTVYIGEIENGILQNVRYEAYERKTDFKVEEIVETRKKMEETKSVLSQLENEIRDFGMYDY